MIIVLLCVVKAELFTKRGENFQIRNNAGKCASPGQLSKSNGLYMLRLPMTSVTFIMKGFFFKSFCNVYSSLNARQAGNLFVLCLKNGDIGEGFR